jgi:hypothetical protein
MNHKYHPKIISEIITIMLVIVTKEALSYPKFYFVITDIILGGPRLLQVFPYYLINAK